MTEDIMSTVVTEEDNTEDDAELYSTVSSGARPAAPAPAVASPGGAPAEVAPSVLPTGPDGEVYPFHEIEFVHDVPLKLSVEIGQTSLSVRDILGLSVGKSIEFTKVVGEPMDITISGKLMARGEIVVVNERYGVRISEVTRPDDEYSSET